MNQMSREVEFKGNSGGGAKAGREKYRGDEGRLPLCIPGDLGTQ